jgi:peptidoglycan hydrolase CwlO-like protein
LKKSLEEQNLKQEKIIGDSQLEVDNLRKSLSDYQSQVHSLEKLNAEKVALIEDLNSAMAQLKTQQEALEVLSIYLLY